MSNFADDLVQAAYRSPARGLRAALLAYVERANKKVVVATLSAGQEMNPCPAVETLTRH